MLVKSFDDNSMVTELGASAAMTPKFAFGQIPEPVSSHFHNVVPSYCNPPIFPAFQMTVI